MLCTPMQPSNRLSTNADETPPMFEQWLQRSLRAEYGPLLTEPLPAWWLDMLSGESAQT